MIVQRLQFQFMKNEQSSLWLIHLLWCWAEMQRCHCCWSFSLLRFFLPHGWTHPDAHSCILNDGHKSKVARGKTWLQFGHYQDIGLETVKWRLSFFFYPCSPCNPQRCPASSSSVRTGGPDDRFTSKNEEGERILAQIITSLSQITCRWINWLFVKDRQDSVQKGKFPAGFYEMLPHLKRLWLDT